MDGWAFRALVLSAGLAGAAGVAGAALAAHGQDDRLLVIAAAVTLVHAPALLALGLAGPARSRLFAIAGLALALGVFLFSGDLAARALLGGRLFANAAPLGGGVLIVGWLALAILGCFARRRPSQP